MEEPIDLTPAGFEESNPKRAENIQRANKAIKERDNGAYKLADLLQEIVGEIFGDIQELCECMEDRFQYEFQISLDRGHNTAPASYDERLTGEESWQSKKTYRK